MLSSNRMQLDGRRARLIPQPRSDCPINRSLEMLGDRWSLLILRDIVLHDRCSFRELLTSSEEGISAPVLSRRLADLGAHIDPSTAHNAPKTGADPEDLIRRIAALRKAHAEA